MFLTDLTETTSKGEKFVDSLSPSDKNTIDKDVLKTMERLSYQEFFYLYDRVETLEQSDEIQKLQTEIKEQSVKHELAIDEQNIKIDEQNIKINEQNKEKDAM